MGVGWGGYITYVKRVDSFVNGVGVGVGDIAYVKRVDSFVNGGVGAGWVGVGGYIAYVKRVDSFVNVALGWGLGGGGYNLRKTS